MYEKEKGEPIGSPFSFFCFIRKFHGPDRSMQGIGHDE